MVGGMARPCLYLAIFTIYFVLLYWENNPFFVSFVCEVSMPQPDEWYTYSQVECDLVNIVQRKIS